MQIYRALLMVVLFGSSISAADQAQQDMLAQIDGHWVFDHDRLGESLHEEDLAAARGVRVAVGHSPRDSWLAEALVVLAASNEQYALRTKRYADAAWFRRDGGLGTYRVGRPSHPDTRVEEFGRRMGKGDIAGKIDAAGLLFSSDDISPGRKVEITHTVHRVRFDVKSYSVSLSDVLTENITAQRIFGRGPGTGGVVYTQDFPLELPTTETRGVETSAVAPAGKVPNSGVIGQITTKPQLHARDSRVASRNYAAAMAALGQAYPDTTWVWVTVPLEARENFQRNAYNHYLRAFMADDRVAERPIVGNHILFDVAALMSHNQDGTLVMDQQGPVIALDWLADDHTSLNEGGQQRIAKAWWHLLSQVAVTN